MNTTRFPMIRALLLAFAPVGFALLSGETPKAAAPVLTEIATVTLPVGSSSGITVNTVTHNVYVLTGVYSNDAVSVIDPGSFGISNIPVFQGAFHVAVNEVTNRIYVNHTCCNKTTVIDGHTNTVLDNIWVGTYNEGIAINPLTNRIYVANTNSQTISVIDGATNAVVSTIAMPPLAGGDLHLAALPALNRLYVSVNDSLTEGHVYVIDITTESVVDAIVVPGVPTFIKANEATERIYVAGLDEVVAIDGQTLATIATVPVGHALWHGLAVDSVMNRVYVTNYGENILTMIDGVTNTATPVPLSLPGQYVAVDSSNGRVYVTTTNPDHRMLVLESTPPTPAEAVQNLLSDLATLSLPSNITGSLSAPLNSIDTSNVPSSCGKLNAFINHVNSKTPPLTAAQAAQLLQSANNIRTALGCTGT